MDEWINHEATCHRVIHSTGASHELKSLAEAILAAHANIQAQGGDVQSCQSEITAITTSIGRIGEVLRQHNDMLADLKAALWCMSRSSSSKNADEAAPHHFPFTSTLDF